MRTIRIRIHGLVEAIGCLVFLMTLAAMAGGIAYLLRVVQ